MLRGNRGQVLLLFALILLFTLTGIAALAIDVGYMYSVRHELQRCADSGALAGASVCLDNTALPGDAESVAENYAMMDNVVKTQLTASEVTPTPCSADNQVRVVTQRTVNLFFARIWQPSLTISASATAEGRALDNTVRLVE